MLLLNLLTSINQVLWGAGLVILLLGTGVLCLFCRKGACLKSFGLLFHRQKMPEQSGAHGISVFESCMTSLAAAMGTGNLVGVATALTLGGAGAVFWMWVSAFCGMGLIYAENVLSCEYRSGHCAGAVAYLRYGLNSPRLADIFAVCCLFASFGMGNMTQSHAMAEILTASFGVPAWVTGICTGVLLGVIILGGSKRTAKFSSVMIPVLTGIYFLLCLIMLIRYRTALPGAFMKIFREAFHLSAVGGGLAGTAVKQAISVGVRRGVFSNEAGLGSSGLLHGEADSENPQLLGLCGMLEVIADTFLCCTLTALVILCAGEPGRDGAELVLKSFRAGLGTCADWILPPMIVLYAFSTLTGWSYCGTNALKGLTDGRYIRIYQIIFCLAAGAGAVMKMEFVWTLADIANACMAYCNLPGILLLYPGRIASPGIDCKNAH